MRHFWEHDRFDPKGRIAWQARVAKDHPDVNAVYPPGFWKQYAAFCAGDASKLGMAVAFLEADPWVFGSGCVKEDFIQAIKHMELPLVYVTRLQNVVLSVVDRRDGREFRDYCRLARKVDAPNLRAQLIWRLTRTPPGDQLLTHDQPSLLEAIQKDLNVRRRARWVLEALEPSHQRQKHEQRGRPDGRRMDGGYCAGMAGGIDRPTRRHLHAGRRRTDRCAPMTRTPFHPGRERPV